MTGDVIWGLMIPFIGTAAGSAMVYLMRGQMRPAIQKILTGFAAGVMIAASVWSLLLPAIDKSEELGLIGWLPPAVGFLLGMGFLLLLDTFTPHQHMGADEPEGIKTGAKKNTTGSSTSRSGSAATRSPREKPADWCRPAIADFYWRVRATS